MLLGIDLGTTTLKVAAYDEKKGILLHGVEERLLTTTGPDGRREQDPAALDKAFREAIRQVGKAVGGLKACRGVGLAAQGGSMVLLDRDTGAPRTPLILWNDGRAAEEFQELSKSNPTRFWRARTQRDEPGMGLARIALLREQKPDCFNDTAIYAGVGELLFHRLTGVWRQDVCNAMQSGVYDTRKAALSAELAALGGVTPDFFAPLRAGHETHPLDKNAAKTLGLPAGIPVAGPYMDHEAGFLSVAGKLDRPLQCSLGTAWVGNFSLPKGVTGRSPFQFAIPAPHGDGQLVIQPLLTGNVTWDWALRTFVDEDLDRALEDYVALLDDRFLPEPGLVGLPWLNRPNSFAPGRLGSATLHGMSPSTDRAELLRAVLSGMCFELKRVFRQVLDQGIIGNVVLSGGASQGLPFRRLLGALFDGIPVHQVREESWMGTRGVLYPFSKRCAQARLRRVPIGHGSTPHVGWQLEHYEEVWERLCGHVTAGQAYTVQKGDKGRT